MQYFFDGFTPGDPSKLSVNKNKNSTSKIDVLIIGCGPAGLTLAAQLAAFPDISTRIIERKSGPLEIGQADGIACRSMEMFQAFGFVEKVLKEAYWVNETCFWRPEKDGQKLTRADRIQDVEDDLSELPHTILSQARIHDFFLEVMENAPGNLTPDYNLELSSLEKADDPEFPVKANVLNLADGNTEVIRASYVVGCDGSRSKVRKSLGYALKGESARQLWGVMDVLAVTDFPDIRLKCAIQSAKEGSILIIPREGGAMVRLYIELDALEGDERAADRNVTPDTLIARTRAILSPYTFEVKEVVWCSAYEIGQRVSDAFDDLGDDAEVDQTPRIFIAGDACHTHSPKAGQGMNVSMADTFNLGWKLASVLHGQSHPKLLNTYSAERRAKAQELIDFDNEMAKLFSSKKEGKVSAELFQQYFQKHGRYTAGVATRYDPSLIVDNSDHQALAKGLQIGMRFHSAPVIRLADAKPVQLSQALKADGRWRLIAFSPSDDFGDTNGAIAGLCGYLENADESPIKRYTQAERDLDSMIDLRVVFQASHRHLALETMPELLLPEKGKLQLTNYEKIFCPDLKHGPDIFDLREVDRTKGAIVIVRPDQFIAGVLPLGNYASLAKFFDGFMLPVKS